MRSTSELKVVREWGKASQLARWVVGAMLCAAVSSVGCRGR